ncbi:hypothetical protein [Paenarthrobacter sp. C1]|uniref:hypothetical protein n=1 Tax=Paenarthrobacter sp. C1 TaxID=3400220 RepID=UPI003BF4E8EC
MKSETLIATSIQYLSINSNFSAKSQILSNFLGTIKQLELLARGYAANKQPRWSAVKLCVGQAQSFLELELRSISHSPSLALSQAISDFNSLPEQSDKSSACVRIAEEISQWRSQLNHNRYGGSILTAARNLSDAGLGGYLAGAFSALLVEQGWNYSGLSRTDLVARFTSETELLDYLFPSGNKIYELTFAIRGVRKLAEIEKVLSGAFCWRVKDEGEDGPSLVYYNVDKESRSKFKWHFSHKVKEGRFAGCFVSFEWAAPSGQIAAVQARTFLEGKLENYRAGRRAPHARLQETILYSLDGRKVRSYGDEPMRYSKSSAYPALHETSPEIERLFGLNRLAREAHSESIAAMYGWIFFESAGMKSEAVQSNIPKLLALQEFRNDLVTLRSDITTELSVSYQKRVRQLKSTLWNYRRSISVSPNAYKIGDEWTVNLSRTVILQQMRAVSANLVSQQAAELDLASSLTSHGRTANPNSWFSHLSSWAQRKQETTAGEDNLAMTLEILSKVPEFLPICADRLGLVKSTLSSASSLRSHLSHRRDYYSGLLNTMYAVRNMASHEGRIGSIDLIGFGMLSGWLTDAYLEILTNWFRKSRSVVSCVDVALEIVGRYDQIVDSDYLDLISDFGLMDLENLTQPGWANGLTPLSPTP